MMKATLLVCLGLILIGAPGAAAEISGRSGLTFESWSSDEDESGSQWYVPVQVSGEYGDATWFVTGGYAYTRGEFDGDSRSLGGILDTQAGAAYTLRNRAGADWMLGIDLNLPTGRTGQDERDLRIMVDPDLVSINTPGRGFNVNPYFSVARQFRAWTIGLGAGYAFQGEYDYSEQVDSYDPGDIATLSAQVEYALTEEWSLSLNSQYLTIGTDKVDGDELLQKGDAWLFGIGVRRAGPKWETRLSLQSLFRDKARILKSDGNLDTEARNSQGDEWIADLETRHRWRPSTTLIYGVQYRYLSENEYARSSPFYAGKRQKVSLSLGIVQRLAASLDLECTLKGFSMADDPNWLHPDEERTYTGWALSAAIAKHF
jgi:hypothetical protein